MATHRELAEEVLALRARERTIKESPFFFFSPWGQQIDFMNSPAKIRIVQGSNRVGKSTIGGIEDIAHAMGCRPDGSKKNLPAPPTKGLIVVSDFAKITEVMMPKIRQYVSDGWITHIKNGSTGAPEFITWKTGSTIRVASGQQPINTFESADWHWVHFDEPPKHELWAPVLRGITDNNGRIWMTMTPLSCPWIYTDLVQKADGHNIATFFLHLKDNPHISQEAKDFFIAQIPPEERDARIEGKFSHLAGSIFPEFRRDRHVVRAHTPPDDAPIFMVMDPHDRRPSYMMWCYVNQRGQIVVFAEWPKYEFWSVKKVDHGVREYSKIIRDVEGNWSHRVVERIMDPNFGRSQTHSVGKTVAEEYDDYGLSFFVDICNDIPGGHHRIHDLLGSENREPGLLICDNCTNMIWAFDVYSWKMKDMEDRFSGREKPDEAGKDQIDTIRYLLDYGPSFDMGGGGDPRGSFTPQELGGGYG